MECVVVKPFSMCRMCGSSELHPAGEVQGFAYVACADCGFVFTPEVVREKVEQRPCFPPDQVPEQGWAAPDFLDPAFERLGPGRALRILDFGAGESMVPDALRRRGHRVIAVDLVPPRTEHPDRLTGSLISLNMAPDQFDLAYAFQVFEHLPEPAPILTELLRLTRPGGLVLIHTDMEVSERQECAFTDWWYVMPPQHCAFYHHRTFEKFLEGTPHRITWRDPKRVMIEVEGQREREIASPRKPRMEKPENLQA